MGPRASSLSDRRRAAGMGAQGWVPALGHLPTSRGVPRLRLEGELEVLEGLPTPCGSSWLWLICGALSTGRRLSHRLKQVVRTAHLVVAAELRPCLCSPKPCLDVGGVKVQSRRRVLLRFYVGPKLKVGGWGVINKRADTPTPRLSIPKPARGLRADRVPRTVDFTLSSARARFE
eukprot:scaffold35472_cov31-Tisochrysis_lutea.AAC.1